MTKSPRVTFKMQRIEEGDWQIQAHYPGAEIRYIKGFKSKAEGEEAGGSQSYVPPEAKDDKALQMALDLLRGTKLNAAFPPSSKTSAN